MHRTGHWLGLDIHDCGNYIEPSEADRTTERQDPLTGQSVTGAPAASCVCPAWC